MLIIASHSREVTMHHTKDYVTTDKLGTLHHSHETLQHTKETLHHTKEILQHSKEILQHNKETLNVSGKC